MKIIQKCPICDCSRYYHLEGYDSKRGPEIYRYLGLDGLKSRWSVCKNCAFLFQNPRPLPQAILALYESGLYRQNREYSDDFFKNRYTLPLLHLSWSQKKTKYLPKYKVLDVGAGYGGAVRAFRDKGLDAFGVELDPNLCEEARKRFEVEVVNTDVMDCPFEEESFGMIYSAHVHEHFDDFNAINRKLVSMLVPGGIMLIVLPTYRFSAKNGQGFINVFHNSIFTKTSLKNMFLKCGLKPLAFHYPIRSFSAEIWGLAVKESSRNVSAPTEFYRDNWRFVVSEIRYSPLVFQFLTIVKEKIRPAVEHFRSC